MGKKDINVGWEFNAQKFHKTLKDIKVSLGDAREFSDPVLTGAKKLLEIAVAETNPTSRAIAERKVREANKPMKITDFDVIGKGRGRSYRPKRGAKGRAFMRVAGKTYNLGFRYSAATWSIIKRALNITLRINLRAIGVAKKSWHLIAKELDLELDIPQWVKNAEPRTYVQNYINSCWGETQESTSAFTVEIRNVTTAANSRAAGGEFAMELALRMSRDDYIKKMEKFAERKSIVIARKNDGIELIRQG